MPPPVARKNYDKIPNKLGETVEKVAKASMIQASVEVKENEITDIGILYDGTWQKRGYSSLNGVGTAISITTVKVLDCEVLSRHCKSCTIHYPLKESNPAEYEAGKSQRGMSIKPLGVSSKYGKCCCCVLLFGLSKTFIQRRKLQSTSV